MVTVEIDCSQNNVGCTHTGRSTALIHKSWWQNPVPQSGLGNGLDQMVTFVTISPEQAIGAYHLNCHPPPAAASTEEQTP